MTTQRVDDLLRNNLAFKTSEPDYYSAGPYAKTSQIRGYNLLLTVPVNNSSDIQDLLDGGPKLSECEFTIGLQNWKLDSWEVELEERKGILFFKGYEKKLSVRL